MALKGPNGRAEKISQSFGKENLGELVPYTLRLHEKDLERLKSYFQSKGIGLSTGIRQVVREFITQNLGE